MRVLVGADDSSPTVDAVIESLRAHGFDVTVLEPSPWPRVAIEVAEAVAGESADLGVLFCWTGTGTSMMANKVPGVRAALCWEPWIAEGARKWNDANVLVMSLKRTSPQEAIGILDAWLAVPGPDQSEEANIALIEEYEKARR